MKKMTELEAQVLAGILWEELAEKGCYKNECNFWKNQKIKYDSLNGDCTLCSFYGDCEGCVIYKNNNKTNCDDWDSVFRRWAFCKDIKKRKEYAKEMLDLIFGKEK